MAQTAKTTQQQFVLPVPYLRIPFDGSEPVHFLAGWDYDAAEIARHGIESHGAIDWARPYGSPVYAAAAGYAVATWDERWLTDDEGKPKLYDRKHMTFGQGLTVQIYHGKGRYTQYGHLSRLPQAEGRPGIPFYEPAEDDGTLATHPILRVPVREYRRHAVAAKVGAGDLIGFVGLTGGAIGVQTYGRWRALGNGKRLTESEYETYMSPHLHFVEFRRQLKSRQAERRDPFGLYATKDRYPTNIRDWSRRAPGQEHHSLWLPS